jgi:hypothetical protein
MLLNDSLSYHRQLILFFKKMIFFFIFFQPKKGATSNPLSLAKQIKPEKKNGLKLKNPILVSKKAEKSII